MSHCLSQLVTIFGPEWAEEKLIPSIMEMRRNPNYLYRMTALFFVNQVAEHLPAAILTRVILPSVLTLAQDPVPNVRFNAAKSLQKVGEKLGRESWRSEIKPVLDRLVQDADGDVKYFATQALKVGA
jgi:serine/threonine-protein phosphatase 2A regulatory subunit A